MDSRDLVTFYGVYLLFTSLCSHLIWWAQYTGGGAHCGDFITGYSLKWDCPLIVDCCDLVFFFFTVLFCCSHFFVQPFDLVSALDWWLNTLLCLFIFFIISFYFSTYNQKKLLYTILLHFSLTLFFGEHLSHKVLPSIRCPQRQFAVIFKRSTHLKVRPQGYTVGFGWYHWAQFVAYNPCSNIFWWVDWIGGGTHWTTLWKWFRETFISL